MSLCQHTLKIPAIWLNPVHCRGKTNTYGSVFWKRQGEVIADSNVLASVQSQCMWERSETKKTSQISFYFGCKILEGGCLDPSLAHQQPWDVCISIMGYFILFFFFFLACTLSHFMKNTDFCHKDPLKVIIHPCVKTCLVTFFSYINDTVLFWLFNDFCSPYFIIHAQLFYKNSSKSPLFYIYLHWTVSVIY